MSEAVYTIVQHDGGWAYKMDGVFSETFRSREEAEGFAKRVVAEQRVPGETGTIEWEDTKGKWHDEVEPGDDRPDAQVEES